MNTIDVARPAGSPPRKHDPFCPFPERIEQFNRRSPMSERTHRSVLFFGEGPGAGRKGPEGAERCACTAPAARAKAAVETNTVANRIPTMTDPSGHCGGEISALTRVAVKLAAIAGPPARP